MRGLGEVEGAPVFGRERFGEDEGAKEEVGQAEAGGDDEGQPQITFAEQAADGGAGDETGAEGDAD